MHLFKLKLASLLFFLITFSSYTQVEDLKSYLTYKDPELILTGGVKMVPVETELGNFKVYTQQIGNNPRIRILLLHGGPGLTHEAFEPFMSHLPREGVEFIYYDQLGSFYSDQPDDTSLWTTKRFVDEVEQVRKALGLNSDNFYLYGQSWGGILAMEYALAHQDKMKGLIISNMVASVPVYNKYAQEVLGPQMDPEVLAEIKELESNRDFENPRYMELLIPNHYTKHILRMPVQEWPNSVNRAFEHLNPEVYVYMQGPSEFGITPQATLSDWDVSNRLSELSVPTLVVAGKYDTMDPEYMEWMSKEVQNGRYLLCPQGSHLVQYDDPEHFFPGLINFVKDVDNGDFEKK